MARATISRFRQLIRTLRYVVSTHAAEEFDDDNLSILDLENIVLTGQIQERQRDTQSGEGKYVIKALRKSVAVNRSIPVAAFEAVDA